MAELTKIRRVIAKQMPGAPHETLLTVDSTTGQNGLRQAQLFSEAVEVDGIVLTKLDGTAKGGHRAGDRQRARHPGEAHRHRRGARGPAPVRRRRLLAGPPAGVRATLTELVLGGDPAPWTELLGVPDGADAGDGVRLRFDPGRPGGIVDWALTGLRATDLDGLPTREHRTSEVGRQEVDGGTVGDPSNRPGTSGAAGEVLAVDHVVALTDDLARTTAALIAAGLDHRRTAGRTAFFVVAPRCSSSSSATTSTRRASGA
jgi:hypothetical protein